MKALYFDNNIGKILALKVASAFNKYAALGRISPVQYGDVKEPEIPNPRWIKVKNIACGLCGTDLHFIFMDLDPKCFPAAVPGIARKFLGHELLAKVVEVSADAGDFKVGDRVTMRIDWPSCFQMEIDPPCPQCAAGNYMLCLNLGKKELPLKDVGGGFSPYMVMHKTQPFKVPDKLNDDRALLLEPTAGVVHAVNKAVPEKGQKVLVIGAGTIGLLTVAVTRALSPKAEIFCLARHDYQAKIAKEMGADEVVRPGKDLYRRIGNITGAKYFSGMFKNEILLGGFDVIFDSVGNEKSINDALRWAKGQGKVVILGIDFHPAKIDITTIWNQELMVTGINCHAMEGKTESSFDLAAKLLSQVNFPVDQMITHRYPMSKYKDAIHTFMGKSRSKAVKIVLDHEK